MTGLDVLLAGLGCLLWLWAILIVVAFWSCYFAERLAGKSRLQAACDAAGLVTGSLP